MGHTLGLGDAADLLLVGHRGALGGPGGLPQQHGGRRGLEDELVRPVQCFALTPKRGELPAAKQSSGPVLKGRDLNRDNHPWAKGKGSYTLE